MTSTEFNQKARSYGFKGNALRQGAYTNRYKQYIINQSKKGKYPPQLPNIVYNPTGSQDRTRFVRKDKVVRKDGKIRAKYQDLLHPIQMNGMTVLDSYKSQLLPQVRNFYETKQKGSTIDIQLTRLDIKKDLEKIINSLPAGDQILVNHDETFYTLNDNNKTALLKRLQEGMVSAVEESDSIGNIVNMIVNYDSITLGYGSNEGYLIVDSDDEEAPSPGAKKGKTANDGGFFPYTATPKLPDALYQRLLLHSAGVYREVKKENYLYNCLVSALAHGNKLEPSADQEQVQKAVNKAGVTAKEINKIHTMCFTQYIPNKEIPKIAQLLKRKINLWNDDNHKDSLKYGKEYEGEPIKIACLKRHYFANYKIPITNYAVENYDRIRHLNDWWRITAYQPEKGKGARKVPIQAWEKESCWTTKFHALKWLLENRKEYWKPIHYSTNLMATAFHERDDIVRDFETLEYVESDLRGIDEPYLANKHETTPISEKERYLRKQQGDDLYMNFYLDFETFTRGVKFHTPFLACAEAEDGKQFTFWRTTDKSNIGEKVMKAMAEYAVENGKHPRVFAHNMRYDFRFIVNTIDNLQTIEPNGRFVVAWGNIKTDKKIQNDLGKSIKTRIQIRDSYCMISEPLRKFADLFPNISICKDVMPYDVYTPKNYQRGSIPVSECLDNLKPKDHAQFLQNLKLPNMTNSSGLVNLKEYALYYCRKDVTVLREGWNTFRQQILTLTEAMPDCPVACDINYTNTSAKLAHTIMVLSGVYDEVYQTAGVCQAFLARAKVGGRTMTGRNQKHLVKDKPVGNSDANSLYPSAMARMKGYLKGKPKLIDPKKHDLEFLSKQSGYVVEVRISSVRKRLAFPLQSKMVKGIRNFTNNLSGCNITLDNIALEDFMKFHQVRPENLQIIRGYYYDQGYNDTICRVIRYLYAERRKYKKQENPIEKSYKLILNSAYGYSILKPTDSEVVIKPKKDLDAYVGKWFNYIKSYTMSEDGRYARIEQLKTINDHYNLSIAGIQVLSMSKRIMNEVMCLAEDLKIEMWYQDTDSIHLDGTKLGILEQAYELKYRDETWYKPLYGKELGQFSSDFEMKVNGKKIPEDKINCYNAVYLGKKCYIECLEGEQDGVIHHDAHLRMKGVSNGAIQWRCKELGETPLQLYSRLYEKGKGEEFDLLKDEDGFAKPNFKFHSNYKISNNLEFRRFVTFDDHLRQERLKQK